uniref:Large ribosomal subunit protein uL10 n=2 Tax=Thermochaetoides thermophila TaxID=209285 RepID=MRT4_CHATD|nr:RecName: Full=Large ribosomal subunit protein uL10; AltName: Full=Ribosome assembly factor mrt4; AltName: Full=mRNA turnover protein 4 [Thermochaetoides thermophila DSM 1495]8PV1_CF Chain CF, Large ribosomal subunit protein uL10 [Thermochaetoides thermophila DSM 1495]8PV2_CF Chain CF, Large ribosomal subunit protein uL10 [Thermochaetoides thermophila DSM 1495]8PV3_CF Chain CF, Large ribosomal subunit protein uL10 [Thermochaetoides thermophila DSM 1495]8PV4_CF Chain CF, Large ribosomal subuni
MPKSKRARVYHLTQVNKKGREAKERLFSNIRETIPKYQHCFVFSVDNMRNNYLKDVRHELNDCRIFFGKTKLMARALGTTPEEEQADGLHRLTRYLTGTVGLLFTNRDPADIESYFSNLSQVDFARAGTVAPRTVTVPPGIVYSTGGEVPPEHDVPVSHTLEPELRRLGMPVRMIKGKVCLGDEKGEASEGYTICKEGEVLDSRQTRLLKLFSICLSEFKVSLLGYWSSASGEVTELEAGKTRPKREGNRRQAMNGDEMDEDQSSDEDSD